MSKPSDPVQGMLDLLILKILALEPTHGWAISQRVRRVSQDALQVSDGSLGESRCGRFANGRRSPRRPTVNSDAAIRTSLSVPDSYP